MTLLKRAFLVLSLASVAPAVAPCCLPQAAATTACCDEDSTCRPGADGACVLTADAPFLVQPVAGVELQLVATVSPPMADVAPVASRRIASDAPEPDPPRLIRTVPLRL